MTSDGGSSPGTAVLQRCGPYEPGTLTLVAVDDGAQFSYCPGGRYPRSPIPGERVRMRWTTSAGEVPSGEGLVVSVELTAHSGPACTVLWSVPPRQLVDWDPQF